MKEGKIINPKTQKKYTRVRKHKLLQTSSAFGHFLGNGHKIKNIIDECEDSQKPSSINICIALQHGLHLSLFEFLERAPCSWGYGENT